MKSNENPNNNINMAVYPDWILLMSRFRIFVFQARFVDCRSKMKFIMKATYNSHGYWWNFPQWWDLYEIYIALLESN